MNLKLSGTGADRKKVMILVGLVAFLAVYWFWSNSSPDSAPAPKASIPGLPPVTGPRTVRASRAGRPTTNNRSAEEFRPTLKPSKYADIDRATIDPTLHLDLLAKLQSVKTGDTGRSLFDFGQATPAPVELAGVKEPAKIIPGFRRYGPQPPPKPVEPPKPVAPPIPLKFYGFVDQTKNGTKRAFFLDGEDIIVAAEGQLIKNRYKIVRIGINSAVVEDTQFENHQQTLPLVEEVQG